MPPRGHRSNSSSGDDLADAMIMSIPFCAADFGPNYYRGDAIAHQVAVTLLDDIAKMDADAELDQRAVTGALKHTAILAGDRWVDEIGAKRPEPRERSVFVHARQPTEADDIGRKYCRNFAKSRPWL